MNKQFKETQAADMLAQPVKGKQPYISPQFDVIPVEQTSLVCTSVSVGQGSIEDDYDDKGDREGDDFEVDLDF